MECTSENLNLVIRERYLLCDFEILTSDEFDFSPIDKFVRNAFRHMWE